MVRCAAARARGSSLIGLAETLDSKSCRVGHLPTVSGRSRGAPDGSRAGVSRVRAESQVVEAGKRRFRRFLRQACGVALRRPVFVDRLRLDAKSCCTYREHIEPRVVRF